MRTGGPLAFGALLSACTADPDRSAVWIWDAEATCYARVEDGFDPRTVSDDCREVLTPAIRTDGACAILPVSCIPQGFAPNGASCADAVAMWQGGDAYCEGDAPDED